jgi:hypothetical protein
VKLDKTSSFATEPLLRFRRSPNANARYTHPLYDTYIDHGLNRDIVALDERIDSPAVYIFRSVGSIDMGLDFIEEAWPLLHHVFHNRGGPIELGKSSALQDGPLYRLPMSYLSQHPVDCLVVGRHSEPHFQDKILDMVRASGRSRPKMILKLWPIGAILHNQGPVTKAICDGWLQGAGYVTRCCRVHAAETGGAVDQSKLVVIRALPSIEQDLVWPLLLPKVTRLMANCLQPVGIPQRAFLAGPALEWEPSALLDPMPSTPGRIIQTDRGRRRLLKDELAQGFGLPKQQIEHLRLTDRLLMETTSLHILEYLTPLFVQAPLGLKRNEWVSRVGGGTSLNVRASANVCPICYVAFRRMTGLPRLSLGAPRPQ